ncbi:TPA: UDP-phosphate galactose phosphotransferase, partial [Klebsiella aerogenes]|nr:UDP-phosphate galactose phosphotransferase [Klebsiella aerogenes]
MRLIVKNILVSTTLALSDFLGFIISPYLAMFFLSMVLSDYQHIVPPKDIEGWLGLHWLLGFGCVAWYSVRLRHYFYRKTFWFELKEILRTLAIFAVIEIAVMAFTTWSFSRYLWVMSWLLIFILVPLFRMVTKKILNMTGLWMRDTWIIGNGNNAYEAYKAITSERNLGLKIVGFVEVSKPMVTEKYNFDVPIIRADADWLNDIDKKSQFIVAVETTESEERNMWLRNFMIKGYRYVSVIPTLRGMPLDSTDMSFIFSHEVMIFRVQQNLAKWSSRLSKRLFDIFGALSIIIVLSPLLIYISRKVKKDGGPSIYGHERIGKGGKPFNCLKFRSMVINSKEVLEHLLNNDAAAKEEWD